MILSHFGVRNLADVIAYKRVVVFKTALADLEENATRSDSSPVT